MESATDGRVPLPGDAQSTGTRRRVIPAGLPAPLVLIADDVSDNRRLYTSCFLEAGLRVEQAVDGEHALLKVRALRPNLVVMDIGMPVLDGIRATEAIKAAPETALIPVIILTGHATPENLHRARAAGADAVLTKPCLPQDLLTVVRRLLNLWG